MDHVLSGRWWIESMDGTRIEQGGDFSFGEIRLHRKPMEERPQVGTIATNPAA